MTFGKKKHIKEKDLAREKREKMRQYDMVVKELIHNQPAIQSYD